MKCQVEQEHVVNAYMAVRHGHAHIVITYMVVMHVVVLEGWSPRGNAL